MPDATGRRRGRGGRHLRRLPATRARRRSTPTRSSPCGSSSTAATAWPGRWSAHCSSASTLDPIETYWVPDGEFPDHEPNPLLPENRHFIIDRVLAEGADLGIAWDGDADRCFFIDGSGEFVDGDFLTALLAEPGALASSPAPTILYDVRASRAVPDTVAPLGGTSHMNRVGHAFFKQAMREHGAAFGGEVSGHYYFRDFWCADSGTLPALLVLELLSVEGRPLSELVGELRAPLLHLRRDQLRGRRSRTRR